MNFINRMQHTIAEKISISGTGVHSGQKVNVELIPASENHGIIFLRTDVKGDGEIPATYQNVVDTNMCTVIANHKGISISTVEHIMSALWGCEIDNIIIKVDAPEMPIMDGSSQLFVEAIETVGKLQQSKPRKMIEIIKPIKVEVDGKTIEILPSENFSVEFGIEFEHKSIENQSYHFSKEDTDYSKEISKARTFGFLSDLEKLKKLGLAKGASLKNAIGIGENGIMNTEGLRYNDEFVRHKILDCIGDLYLSCMRIKGRVKAFKAGHTLNNLLLRKIFSEPDSYRIIECMEA